MRPLLPGDISAAARALLPVPPEARAMLASRLIAEAEAADAYRQRHGRVHATWGDGTLMAAALARPTGRETGSEDYLDCQFIVIQALLSRDRPATHRNPR